MQRLQKGSSIQGKKAFTPRQPLWLFGLGCLALAHPFRGSTLGTPTLLALLGLLLAFVGVELTSRRRTTNVPWPSALYVLPIAGLALLPLSHSPTTSLVAVVTLVASVSLATFVANRRSTDQIVRSVEFALLTLLLVGLALYPTSAGSGLDGWTGAFGHKNELGRAAGLTLIFGLGRWRTSGARRAIPLVAAGVTTLLLAKSATPVVAVVVAIAAARVLSSSHARGRTVRGALITGTALAFGFGFQALALGNAPLQFVAELLGRRADRNTIFVRESLWRWTIDEAMSHPWAGRGIGIPLTDGEFVRVFTGNGYVDWYVSQPHNGYIEAFFQLGAVGLVATGIGVFWTLKQGRGRLPMELGVYFLMLNFSYSLMIAQGTMIRTIWYAIVLSTIQTTGALQPTESAAAPVEPDDVSSASNSVVARVRPRHNGEDLRTTT